MTGNDDTRIAIMMMLSGGVQLERVAEVLELSIEEIKNQLSGETDALDRQAAESD